MYTTDDIVISISDAEALALMLGDRGRREAVPLDSVENLTEALQIADIVPDEELPRGRIAMGAEVTYENHDGAGRHSVTLVFPADAAPQAGLVSVLSPIGTALIGRRLGEEVEVALPNGFVRTLRIVAVHGAGIAESGEAPATATTGGKDRVRQPIVS
jgi:regulator of nucleoside diphosphate kinase